jgi:hypothetical protein
VDVLTARTLHRVLRRLVIITLMCVALGACSSSSKTSAPGSTSDTATTAANTAATTTANTTTNTTVALPTTSASVGTSTSPAGSAAGVTRTEWVFIDSVSLAAHTITVDPMSFLTGAAAVTAFKHDNPTAKEGPEDDYYIVNTTKNHDVMALAPNAVVRLVHVAGQDHTQPVLVPESNLAGYPGLPNRPFHIALRNGTVTSIVEHFTP